MMATSAQSKLHLPRVVSRAEWLVARNQFLKKEKEFTRQRDALRAERRKLPMVKIDKEYVFEGAVGLVSLRDLFGNLTQLIIYPFIFDPSSDDGCHTSS